MPRFTFNAKADFSDVEAAIRKFKAEVRSKMAEVGAEAVNYAKENGNYHDVTGHLRASNSYEVSEDGLTVQNTADYAADVEARGLEVISGAAIYAEKRLKEIFE